MLKFIFIGALFSFNAFADCGKQIEVLKQMEGFREKCYPDNTQGSAGYGSGSLCKKIKAEYRQTTQKEAERHLRFIDFPEYKQQTAKLGLIYNENELCTLTTLIYNKGARNIRESGFTSIWNKWKQTKSKKAKQDVIENLLKMSCQKQNGKWRLVDGLFARQGNVARMLFGTFNYDADYEKSRVAVLSHIELKERFEKYCNDKNKQTAQLLNELIDTIIK